MLKSAKKNDGSNEKMTRLSTRLKSGGSRAVIGG